MSGVFSLQDAKAKINALNFPALVKYQLKEHKQTQRHLSLSLNKEHNYLNRKIKTSKPDPVIILALSMHLGVNLFEPFQNLLPENIRATQKEKELQQQIADLQKQLADITRERDLLERVVMRG